MHSFDGTEDTLAKYEGSIPGSGRSPGGGHGNPFQYCGESHGQRRGAWWAIVVS